MRHKSKSQQSGFTVIELVVIIIIIIILSSIIFAGYSGIAARERNDERRNDIELLQEQFEFYYAKVNAYPSLSQVNDITWLEKNLREFKKEIVRDPSGAKFELVADPSAKSYAYKALTADGRQCDNKDRICTQYTLTATYEGGGTYTRSSRN